MRRDVKAALQEIRDHHGRFDAYNRQNVESIKKLTERIAALEPKPKPPVEIGTITVYFTAFDPSGRQHEPWSDLTRATMYKGVTEVSLPSLNAACSNMLQYDDRKPTEVIILNGSRCPFRCRLLPMGDGLYEVLLSPTIAGYTYKYVEIATP